MTIIHMETEATKSLAKKLQSATRNLDSSLDDLVRVCHRMDWYGGDRERFITKLKSRQRRLVDLFDRQDQLAFRLQQEINQWLEKGSTFDVRFNWGGFSLIGGETFLELLGNLKIEKIANITKYIPILGFFLGVYEDIAINEDDWARAIISEALETVIYLTPVGWYGLGLGVVSLGAYAYGGITGNIYGTGSTLEFIEKIDLVDKLGDGVADFLDNYGGALADFAFDDPESFKNYLTNPSSIISDPDVSQFVNYFISGYLRDFGWDQGAVMLENSTDLLNQIQVVVFNQTFPGEAVIDTTTNLWSIYLKYSEAAK